jgi:PAS domain S-box-containing protein
MFRKKQSNNSSVSNTPSIYSQSEHSNAVVVKKRTESLTDITSNSDTSSSSTSPQDSEHQKSGFLKKKGLWGRWKEAWFILSQGVLYEYKFRSEKDLKADQKNSYILKDSIIQNADSITGLPNTFSIILEDENSRKFDKKHKNTFFFQANSSMEKQEWIDALSIFSSKMTKVSVTNSSLFLEAFNEAVVMADKMMRIIDFNKSAEEIFGWKREEVVGKNVHILMPNPYASKHDSYAENYREKGEKRLIGKPRKLMGLRKNGSTFPILLSLGELINPEDGQKRLIATIRDLSTEEQISEETVSHFDEKIEEICVNLKKDLLQSVEVIFKKNGELKEKIVLLKKKKDETEENLISLNKQLLREKNLRKLSSIAFSNLICDPKDPNSNISDYIKTIIDHEIEFNKEYSSTLFRQDSFEIRKITTFMLLEGSEYLITTLEPPVLKLIENSNEDMKLENSLILIYEETQFFFDNIINSYKQCPKTFCDLFHHIKNKMLSMKQYNEITDYHCIIGGFLFLRFFVPAIIQPDKYGIITTALPLNCQKRAIYIGKVLQNLSNGALFQDNNMNILNNFISKNKQKLYKFFDKLIYQKEKKILKQEQIKEESLPQREQLKEHLQEEQIKEELLPQREQLKERNSQPKEKN